MQSNDIKPTCDSILIDLDETLFSHKSSLIDNVISKVYPDITDFIGYPLSNHLRNSKNAIAMFAVIDALYLPRMYVEEHIYKGTYDFVKYLIENKYDVWFVTMPNQHYHIQCSIQEKLAQIQRYFGIQQVQKVIFEKDKHLVTGKYLIDDNHNLKNCYNQANWKHIIVTQLYNKNMDFERRVNINTITEDFLKIQKADQEYDVKQIQ